MFESVKDFVPLDEFQSERLRIVAQLPQFIDQHSIGINKRRIDFLCRLSGIKHLRVETTDDSRVSGYEPQVCGVDNKGNAYAAKGGIATKVDILQLDSKTDGSRLLAQKQVSGVMLCHLFF